MYKRLLIVLFLINFVFSQTYVDKPWNRYPWINENQYIFNHPNGKNLWNVHEMDESLDSLRLEDVDLGLMNEKPRECVESAIEEKGKAEDEKGQCIDEINLLGLISTGVHILTGPNGVYYVLSYVYEVDSSLIQSCSEYGGHWKNTMTSSIEALEYSVDVLENKLMDSENEFSKIEKAGLCDDDYEGPGGEDCKHVEISLGAMGTNVTGGSVGDYNKVMKNLESISEKVDEEKPILNEYKETLDLIWENDGALESVEALFILSENALEGAEEEYDFLKISNDGKKEDINKKINEMKGEKIYLIRGATTIDEGFGTISERFEILEGDFQSAKRTDENAEKTYSRKNRGYLKDGINGKKTALNMYETIEYELNEVETEAEDVVYDKRTEAEEEIEEFEILTSGKVLPEDSRTAYEISKEKLEDGDEETNLGRKYQYYEKSAEYARRAASFFNNVGDAALEIESEINEIKTLLGNAKKDDIDVYSEEVQLKVLEKMEKEAWMLEELLLIKNSIVEKAELKYGYLKEEREKIFALIELGGNCLLNVKTDILEIEGDSFIGGELNYEESIGNLRRISDAYREAKLEIESKKSDLILNSMIKSTDTLITNVYLDEPAEIKVVLFFENTLEFEAEDLNVVFDVPEGFELSKGDLITDEGIKEIIHNGDKITVYFEKIQPNQVRMITFEKTMVIAHTSRLKTESKGSGDGSVLVDEERDFELDMDAESVNIPEYLKNVKIDGLGYRSRGLDKGSHRLIGEYEVEDGYSIEYDNYRASNIGMNAKVEYDVIIVPSMNIDEIIVFVNDVEAKGFSVMSYTGERIDSKKSLGNGLYTFTVHDIKNDKNCIARVSFIVENSTGYIEKQLDILNDGEYEEEIDEKLGEVEDSIANGDVEDALEKLEEAKNMIKDEVTEKMKKKEKYEELVDDIERELRKLNETLELGDELNVSIPEIETRVDVLEDALDEEGTIDDKIEILSSIDMKWTGKEATKVRKEAFKEFNDLKERFLASGNEELPVEFSSFEESLRRLGVSNSIKDVPKVLSDLKNLKKLVGEAEKITLESYDMLRQEFLNIKNNLLLIVSDYDEERVEADGSHLESLFNYTKKEILNSINDAEDLLENGEVADAEKGIESIERIYGNVLSTMSFLKKETTNKIATVENIYSQMKDSLGNGDRETIEQGMTRMKQYAGEKRYVKSLKAADWIMEKMEEVSSKDETGILILGVTSLLVIGALAVYLYKHSKDEKPEKEKPMKKLKKIR